MAEYQGESLSSSISFSSKHKMLYKTTEEKTLKFFHILWIQENVFRIWQSSQFYELIKLTQVLQV